MQNPSRPGGGDQLARVNRRGGFGGSVGAEATASRLSAPITEVITADGASPTLITTPSGCQHAPPRCGLPIAANLPRSTATDVRPRARARNLGEPYGFGPSHGGNPKMGVAGQDCDAGHLMRTYGTAPSSPLITCWVASAASHFCVVPGLYALSKPVGARAPPLRRVALSLARHATRGPVRASADPFRQMSSRWVQPPARLTTHNLSRSTERGTVEVTHCNSSISKMLELTSRSRRQAGSGCDP
jgi:hypothetical protein